MGKHGSNRRTKGNQGATKKASHPNPEQQQPRADATAPPSAPPTADQPHPFLALLRVVSGPAFIVGGASVIPTFFWFGVGCIYFGFICLMAEAIWDPRMLRWPYQFQVAALGGIWTMMTIFTIAFVGKPAPLNLAAIANLGDYPDGSAVDGITWKAGMSELRILIANPTDTDFEKLDLHVKSDQWVRQVVQVGTVGNLSISTDDPSFAILHMRSPDGKDIPIVPTGASYGFRILCERVPRKSRIEILAATGVPSYAGVDGVRVRVANIPESENDWPPGS